MFVDQAEAPAAAAGASRPCARPAMHAERVAASQHAEVEEVLVALRALGRLPKERKKPKDEDQRKESALACRLRRLREYMSPAQQGELDRLSVPPPHTEVQEVLAEVRALGRPPKDRHVEGG